MANIADLTGIQIYEVMHVRPTDCDHHCRDLERVLVLSGANDDGLQRRLTIIRESIEDPTAHARDLHR